MLRESSIVYITILIATTLTVACKNSSNSTLPPAPTCSVTTNGCEDLTARGFSGGAAAVLNLADSNVLSTYAGTYVNPTSSVMVNINTKPVNNNYLGFSNVQYFVGSVNHLAKFTNGTNTDHGNNVHILTTDSSGVPAYRLFFEDPAGVIIIVMYSATSGSDTSLGTLSGSVYFRNFNSPAPNPLYQGYIDPYTGTYFAPRDYNFCWSGNITTGPYDCRNMSTPPSLTGTYAVTLLGTFTGMDKKAALGL